MKKYLFGLFAIALAIGFSAFTTAADKLPVNQYIFYDIPGTGTQVKSNFQYNAAIGRCVEDETKKCSALWDQSTAPTDGQQPASNATYVSGQTLPLGDFEP